MQKMMETLTQRAQLQEKEKIEFYENLEKLTFEKDKAQSRIREMEEDRDNMSLQLSRLKRDMNQEFKEFHNPLIEQLLHHPEMRDIIMKNAPVRIIQKRFRRVLETLPAHMIDEFKNEGIINRNGELSLAGQVMLKTMCRRYQ